MEELEIAEIDTKRVIYDELKVCIYIACLSGIIWKFPSYAMVFAVCICGNFPEGFTAPLLWERGTHFILYVNRGNRDQSLFRLTRLV